MTFDQVMQLTRTISSPTAFDDEECYAYWELLDGLKEGSTIVEIGLQFGRSTSIAAQVAKYRGLLYVGIDPFLEANDARGKWKVMMNGTGLRNWIHFDCRSGEVDPKHLPPITLALIDGDHSAEGVRTDCRLLKPLIKTGGYICFHDFDRPSLPDVGRVARADMAGWKHVKTAGTLGVFQKV